MHKKISSDFIRNFVFGIEDSLVSTVGLVSGIAVTGISKGAILIAGVILVFVEAFSMAAGSLISDNSAKEFSSHGNVSIKRSISASLVMFLSYFFSGFVVLAPYIFLESGKAFWLAIILAVASLFILGIYTGKISGVSPYKKGLTMSLIGGMAIIVGVLVGSLLQKLI